MSAPEPHGAAPSGVGFEPGPYDEESSNVPAVPDTPGQIQQVTGIPVAVFEGEYIRHMIGKLPALEVAMLEGYPKNTVLDLKVRVRVRDVAFPEKRINREKVPVRYHNLAFESVQIEGAYTMQETEVMDPGVTGGADE